MNGALAVVFLMMLLTPSISVVPIRHSRARWRSNRHKDSSSTPDWPASSNAADHTDRDFHV
eukprot:1639418-Alexandrium_andersonii.AAC.1